jgi:hypothetical protein
MIITWAIILAVIVGVSAVYGGRNCEVPTGGPFHRFLAGHQFVPTHAGRFACKQVK